MTTAQPPISGPVSARSRPGRIASWQVTLGIALFVLGLVVVAQFQSDGPRAQYASDERGPLVQTAITLQSQQDALKAQILDLRAQISDLETKGQGSVATATDLGQRLQDARLAAGLIGLQGPGVVIQLRDSEQTVPPGDNPNDYLVSADDVRTVVEQLWLSGAEGVAVNGERVTTGTAILDIGGTVLVNSAYLAPPYQISAIGPPDLLDRLTASVGFRTFAENRVQAFGIQVDYAEPADVSLPAYAGTITLRYAQPDPSVAPGGGASSPAP
ncbi:MAG TPA: DUF881 domain-containing protein [Candidatus Limnocylindrales bacterium]|jgi:uncharacterized protein YlxW (UPF0749 family)